MRRVALLASLGMLVACANSGAGGGASVATPEPEAPVVAPPIAAPASTVDTGAVEPPQPPVEPRQLALALMPLGDVKQETLDVVSASIGSAYGWTVDVLEPRELLAAAYYKPRKRYRAEKLLDWLLAEKPRTADKIMGLTEVDISTTKGKHEDWGICGLAFIGGNASVVSTYRIKRKLGKVKGEERREKYRARLTDLTAHEFGHNLGLEHCPNQGCIMEDAKGTVLTFNRSTGELCAECRHQLYDEGLLPIPPG
jgi:archaemetzincin